MPETLDALRLPLWGSRLIEASAGTGKTWTIAALYLRLVLGHGDSDSGFGSPLRPAQILVMTFTRAATRELSDRVRARLVDAARCFRGEQLPQPQDKLLHGLLAAYPAGAEREQAAWRLAGAAEAMDEAAVHTIDAWCQRMLREHAFDSGSAFDEALGADERSLLAEAVRDAWRAQVYPLDGDALAAVLACWPGVDALLADLRGLMPQLAPDGAPAGAAPAPLSQVWQQAEARHRQALQQAKQGWVGRLVALRAWLDAQLARKDCPFNRSKLRSDHVASWFDALDAWASTPALALPALTAAGRQRLTPQGLDEARKSPGPLAIPADFGALDEALASLARLAEPADALRLCMARDVARRILALKAASGVYGFADLVERLASALAGLNGARLRERIVQQYPVALVDEFQDTSPRQFGLFDKLYRSAANERATALLLIGDPKQSIYAFRGADIRSYLAARAATAGRHYLLGTNHRSASALVQVVNGLFMQAELRDGPGAFRFRPAAGRQADNPLPFVPVAAQGRVERLVSAAGALPVLTLCHDSALLSNSLSQRRLAQHCAEHIVTLLNDPQAGFDDPRHGFQRLRPADIAVLVRTGREADALRLALRQRRVASIYLSDQDSVLASAEAVDLLRWLRAVARPLDSRLARAALATATLGLPLAELAQLGQDDAAFEQRTEQLRQLNRVWLRQGVLTMLRQTLHLLDLPARWLQQADGERRLTNVLHLAELLQAASSQLQGEQALIRWLAEQLAADSSSADEQVLRLESDADLVKVVTVHKSKGLEYPLVYLPFATSFRGAEQNRRQGFVALPGPAGQRVIDFRVGPEARAAADEERLQEDLRLLYVALTRARHALWVGVAAIRVGTAKACLFHRSALGRLLAGEDAVPEAAIQGLLQDAFGGASEVSLQVVLQPPQRSTLQDRQPAQPLPAAPPYRASFERDWGIGSFSALVRDLAALPALAAVAGLGLGPARAEDLLIAPAEALPALLAGAAQHRFPRGALAGNFLHDQLEWLAGEGFALAGNAALAQRLAQRCERQGWGHWASEVVAWLGELLSTPLPPVGVALDGLHRVLPEMEFWVPCAQLPAAALDRLCQQHLLAGRPRPPLPERLMNGLLMGFSDQVFEHQGRYWVLDYKSNALGDSDAHYHPAALEAAMAEHRYDVQAALYLLALHRLLRQRLGAGYRPAQHLGGAIYLFLRGLRGPAAGCYHLPAPLPLLEALDQALGKPAEGP